MHHVLYPPRVGIGIVEWGELFADRATVGPDPCTCLGDDPVAGSAQGWEKVRWDERGDEDVPLIVVRRFEGGDRHRIGGGVCGGQSHMIYQVPLGRPALVW